MMCCVIKLLLSGYVKLLLNGSCDQVPMVTPNYLYKCIDRNLIMYGVNFYTLK